MKNFSVTITSASELSAVNFLTDNLKKGQTATIVMKETDATAFMNKGGRNGIAPNPFIGHIVKVTTYHGWQLGTNYNQSCQNSAERSGSDKEFVASSSWHTYYNAFFETDKKSGTKFYLQVQKSGEMSSWTETHYFVDGKEIAKEELATWLKTHKNEMPQTQKAAGIAEERERQYNTLTLSKITEIKQGDFSYNLIGEETKVAAVAEAK